MNKFLDKFRNRKYYKTYRKRGWHDYKEVIKYLLCNNHNDSLWNYLLSLRGPDVENISPDTKRIYQGLIRGLDAPGIDTRVFLSIVRFHLYKTDQDKFGEKDFLIIKNSHYRDHTAFGIGMLGEYYINVDPEIGELLCSLREALLDSDLSIIEYTIIQLFKIIDKRVIE